MKKWAAIFGAVAAILPAAAFAATITITPNPMYFGQYPGDVSNDLGACLNPSSANETYNFYNPDGSFLDQGGQTCDRMPGTFTGWLSGVTPPFYGTYTVLGIPDSDTVGTAACVGTDVDFSTCLAAVDRNNADFYETTWAWEPYAAGSATFALPTSFAGTLTADASAQVAEPGTLLLLGVVAGVPLAFYLIDQLIQLFPGNRRGNRRGG